MLILITHELLKIEWRGIVEKLPGLPQQKWLREFTPAFFLFSRSANTVGLVFSPRPQSQTVPQDGERQNDLAVLGLLVVAAQQIRDRPDER